MHETKSASLRKAPSSSKQHGGLPSHQLEEFKSLYREGLLCLSLLRVCACLDGEDYSILNIKFDNLKLRFAICRGGRATERHVTTKILSSVLETIVKVCSLVENEDSFEEEYGLIRIYDDEALEQCVATALARAYRFIYLEATAVDSQLVHLQPCNFIISAAVRFLSFLERLKDQIETLEAATCSGNVLAQEMAMASSIVAGLDEPDLELVRISGLTERDLLANAAFTQLNRLRHKKGKQKAVSFDLAEQTGESSSSKMPADDTWSETDRSWALMAPATSVAEDDLVERFATITKRSRESYKDLLTQDIPIERRAQRRILTEMRRANDAPPFTSLSFIGSSITNILGIIAGPPDTPYEGGIFFLKFEIPNMYPLGPPKCRFITRIWHPNVDVAGKICMNVLNKEWRPVWGLTDLLLAIMSVLGSPNFKDFSASQVVSMYNNRREEFEETARSYVEKYATGEWPSAEELQAPIPNDWMLEKKLKERSY